MMSWNDIYQSLSERVEVLEQDLISIRRHLHKFPEIGRAEYKTSEFLRAKIGEYGPFSITRVGETGFCADLVSDAKKPWIALRADIDALPIQDMKNTEYRSSIDGVCHACGHDFHTTVVLGTAAILAGYREDLPCNIRFIFQHAEEPTPGGAIDFVRAGRLDNIEVVFGLHADPSLAVETIGIIPGWITAQSIHFKISIHGKGGHSSRPHESPDPVHTGISILNDLYSSLPRMNIPESPFVFTVGSMKAGDSYNSIATDFDAQGTLRVTDTEYGDHLLSHLSRTVADYCRRNRLSGEATWIKGAPPVENDPILTAKVQKIFSDILNQDQIGPHRRSMGGEDFSQFLVKCPGVFVNIGVGKGEKLHSGLFDIDEKSIAFAVKIFSWLLLRYEI